MIQFQQRLSLPFLFQLICTSVLVTSSKPAGKLYTAAYLPGEQLEYRVHYGFFNAGTAYMRMTDKYFLVNNKVCFRAEIIGNSSGTFDHIVRIRDVWGSYFDSVYFQPQKSFRSIQENKYRKREETFFDYSKNLARVVSENDTTEMVKISPNVQDIVSGYYFLRLQNYVGLKKNDTLRLNGIFEDSFYNFKILYLGKTRIKTKFGKTNCFIISPIMPENNLFRGKNPIKMWISDDKNRIPVKVEAELILGSVELDLIKHANLKYPLAFE